MEKYTEAVQIRNAALEAQVERLKERVQMWKWVATVSSLVAIGCAVW